MYKFGDIFRFKETHYIYLASKDDGVTYYAAKIVSDPDIIRQFVSKRESIFIGKVQNQPKENALKYTTCFIILTTEKFEGYLAHLANSDKHGINSFEKIRSLNEIDISELKREILENPDVLPPLVIKNVKELER